MLDKLFLGIVLEPFGRRSDIETCRHVEIVDDHFQKLIGKLLDWALRLKTEFCHVGTGDKQDDSTERRRLDVSICQAK